jgi:hypothetical protein
MATSTPAPIPCEGDCDGDGRVAVNELVTAVAIALGQEPLGRCELADSDRDGTVTVADLVRAVGRALAGCGT